MNKYTRDRMIAIGAACAVVVGGVLSTAPASAVTPDSEAPTDAPRSSAELLTTIRTELVASGSTADVAAFDDLSAEQREQLASYFLDVSVAAEVEADATLTSRDSAVVLENGDFAWGEDESVIVGEDPRSSRAASRTTWGTQWFAFAGIKLSETKVTMTYQYSGSNATKMLGYACAVTKNIQPFTEVGSSKSSGYISGGQATAKCKVVVKRGVLTPWGTVAWSTYSAFQRLSAKGNGAVTANRWE